MLLDGLEQVDQRHVFEAAGDLLRTRHRQQLLLASLEQELHAGRDLLDVDRLGEEVLHAKLEALALGVHGARVCQEDEGDRLPVEVLLDAAAELDARHPRQLHAADDERRPLTAVFEPLQRFTAPLDDVDLIAGLLQAQLQHAAALGVRLYDENELVRHDPLPF